jgi:hypothetical protein
VNELGLLLVPLAALAYLTAIGAGATVALAPRLPGDAQAALSPVVGAALVAAASVLLPLGIPARAVAVAIGIAGVLATFVFRARVVAALRAGAAPLVVALAAIALASAPSLARGDWHAASLYGSTDAYHWSSQARAYLDGPPASPVTEHPDRLSYERTRDQHWAVAVPFGVLQLAWITGADPPAIYGALAALIACLLPLVTFVAARACLEWRRELAAAAALVVAGNAALLFATHFSWQQQAAGSAFAFAAALLLRLALEQGAPGREAAAAALLAAAALATYRLGFGPYVLALLGAVVCAYAIRRRDRLRQAGRAVAVFAAALAALAAPSLVALARGLPDFVSGGGFSTAFKRAFPDGQLAEALGLVPSVWASEDGWPETARILWLVGASAVAVAVLALGVAAIRRSRAPRLDFLVAGVALALAGYVVLLVPSFASYLSFKLLSYTAPFLVLLAFSPLALVRTRTGAVAAIAVAALVVPSAVVATVAAIDDSRTPGELTTLPVAVSALPAEAVIAVDVEDPWQQAWAVYYLSDRRVSVERPSFLLTAQGRATDAAAYRHRPVDYVLGSAAAERAVWRGEGLALARS